MDFLELPIFVGLMTFVVGANLLVFVPYFVLRRLFAERLGGDSETVAVNVLFRVGALHGLILALVFADEIVHFEGLRDNVASEAAEIADALRILDNHDPKVAEPIASKMEAYLYSVVYDEWPNLANQELQAQTWLQWELIYFEILDIEPNSARIESVRAHLIKNMEGIAKYREQRLFAASQGISEPFWVIAIAGFLFVTIPFFVYQPRLVNFFLLTVFGTYNGIIIYFVLALSNPFEGPVSLDPRPFQILIEDVRADSSG